MNTEQKYSVLRSPLNLLGVRFQRLDLFEEIFYIKRVSLEPNQRLNFAERIENIGSGLIMIHQSRIFDAISDSGLEGKEAVDGRDVGPLLVAGVAHRLGLSDQHLLGFVAHLKKQAMITL